MNNDLETAAREFQIYKTVSDDETTWSAVEDSGEFEACIRVIEHSAYAKALKRIEELEGELDNKRGAMTLEIHRLMQALTKERQISKMLEEGLGYTWPGLYGETVNAFNKQKLSEVQKLRGE